MRQNTSGRLSLAVSVLACIIAMTGTGYAAISIGTNNIKDNAVTSPKIKNNTVSGKDIKESSLGTVPKASTASVAGSAASVGGVKIKPVRFVINGGNGSATLFAGNGLTVNASCTASELALTAISGADNANIQSYIMDSTTPYVVSQADGGFDNAETQSLLGATADGNVNHVSFGYQSAAGKVVNGDLYIDEGTPDCQVTGFITSN